MVDNITAQNQSSIMFLINILGYTLYQKNIPININIIAFILVSTSSSTVVCIPPS